MKTIYVPIVQGHSTDTGMPMNMAILSGAIGDDLAKVGPLGLAMVKYAAKGGVVKLNYAPVGTLDLVDANTFLLKTNAEAKRMIDTNVISTLAVELDARGEVLETWLADKAQVVTKIAEVRFQKQIERETRPMTPEQTLEQALKAFEGTVIVVSHDRYFLNQVADLLLVLDGKGNVQVIHGNYDTYELMRAQQEAAAKEVEAAERKKEAARAVQARSVAAAGSEKAKKKRVRASWS